MEAQLEIRIRKPQVFKYMQFLLSVKRQLILTTQTPSHDNQEDVNSLLHQQQRWSGSVSLEGAPGSNQESGFRRHQP